MTRRKLTVDRPDGNEQTTTEFDVVDESPADRSFLRVEHATVRIEIQSGPEAFFDVFTRFAQYIGGHSRYRDLLTD
jgi:hypothetical protein